MKLILLIQLVSILVFQVEGNDFTSRIAGGWIANVTQHPYFARLIYEWKSKDIINFYDHSDICGGTIINKFWIITSSYCVVKNTEIIDIKKLKVVVGSQYFLQKYSLDLQQNISLIRVNKNSSSFKNTDEITNEIALIKLKKPLNWTETVKAALLPQKGESLKLDDEVIVAGFGREKQSQSQYEVRRLKTAVLKVKDQSKCHRVSKTTLKNIICASSKTLNNPCNGDTGSGLMKKGKNNQNTIFGIVTFGPKVCDVENSNFFFTKITTHLDWIKGTILGSSGLYVEKKMT